jgi:hypothetical protein
MSADPEERKLAAIMFTDMQSSSSIRDSESDRACSSVFA